jgi:hypothetical protein
VHADAEGRVPRASLELFQRLFRERASRPDVELRHPTWMSDFVSNVRMVDRYRVGRVFLAGDAAHVHSPVGGQGMNMGIQDAYNLGWKLDLVLRGHGGEELLDTYEQERLPVARAVLKGTDVGYSVVFSANPLVTILRERVLIPLLQVPAVQQAVLGRSHQLDVSYRGSQPAQARSSSARHSGHGSPLSRLRLAKGPRAGDRAPDAPLHDPATGAIRRLFDVTRGPHFTLLLFTGRASSGHAHLQALADHATRRLGDNLRAYLIVPAPDRYGHTDPDRSVLVDVDGSAARSYGAVGDVLYLIRPDGHVGVRAQCLHEQALETYLDTIWTAQAARKHQPAESTLRDRELSTSDTTAGAGGG